MTVLLDTSILIDLLRKHPAALRYAGTLESLPLCSEISRVEVLRGLRSSERTEAERLFQALRWAGVDESIARRAGGLGRTWRRSHGAGIGTPDLLIAATAEELGVRLVTLNVKHFPMFRNLRAPYRA